MTIADHDVERWHIAGRTLTAYAVDADAARLDAARHVCIVEGLPPWRPLLRAVYRHTDAA